MMPLLRGAEKVLTHGKAGREVPTGDQSDGATFVFPAASATCHVEMVSPRSDPSPIWAVRCCPSRRAKACSYLPSPMGNGIRLVASDCFPLKDTQILASQTAGLSLQGGLVLSQPRDFQGLWASQPQKHIPWGGVGHHQHPAESWEVEEAGEKAGAEQILG